MLMQKQEDHSEVNVQSFAKVPKETHFLWETNSPKDNPKFSERPKSTKK